MFVVAADTDDFDATVATAVDAGADAPDALAGDDVRVWGVDDESFDAMASGDLVLFYGDGRYVGVGRVGEPFVDEDGWVAATLWEDGTYDHCFTIEGFAAVDLSRAAVHAIFDYSANYYPSTPMQVPDERVANSLSAIDEAVRRYEQRA